MKLETRVLEPLRQAQERFTERSMEMAERLARARDASQPPRKESERAVRINRNSGRPFFFVVYDGKRN